VCPTAIVCICIVWKIKNTYQDNKHRKRSWITARNTQHAAGRGVCVSLASRWGSTSPSLQKIPEYFEKKYAPTMDQNFEERYTYTLRFVMCDSFSGVWKLLLSTHSSSFYSLWGNSKCNRFTRAYSISYIRPQYESYTTIRSVQTCLKTTQIYDQIFLIFEYWTLLKKLSKFAWVNLSS
jgi:hypothetical protein